MFISEGHFLLAELYLGFHSLVFLIHCRFAIQVFQSTDWFLYVALLLIHSIYMSTEEFHWAALHQPQTRLLARALFQIPY